MNHNFLTDMPHIDASVMSSGMVFESDATITLENFTAVGAVLPRHHMFHDDINLIDHIVLRTVLDYMVKIGISEDNSSDILSMVSVIDAEVCDALGSNDLDNEILIEVITRILQQLVLTYPEKANSSYDLHLVIANLLNTGSASYLLKYHIGTDRDNSINNVVLEFKTINNIRR